MRAVFLDRDGVISVNRPDHVKSWEEFRFIPGAAEAIALLHHANFRIFVVTNQAIVNRRIVSADVIEDIHARMLLDVVRQGGYIDDISYCPHDYHEGCQCRKPRPGMLLELAAKWNIDLSRSYIVGDAWTDMAAGRAAGCHTILARTGRGSEHLGLPETQMYPANYVAADLTKAAEWIFEREAILLPPDRETIQIAQSARSWSVNLTVSR
jgi:D-glycero-D-manno-heptose 1,7-bisphosphate phosphatase